MGSYVLDITWDPASLPELPTLVGPFGTESEAQEWADLNVGSDSTAQVRRVANPYLGGISA